TAGKPSALKLTSITDPLGWKSDGADVALVQFEVVDINGQRCPIDNRMVHFSFNGPAEWRGGIAQVKQWNKNELADGTPVDVQLQADSIAGVKAKHHDANKAGSQFLNSSESMPTQYRSDNMAMSTSLPVESGVNRIMLRSLLGQYGEVTLTAKADGLPETSITLTTIPFETHDGLSPILPNDGMKGVLERGETPLSASFIKSAEDVPVIAVESGSNQEDAKYAIDKNERTTWSSSSVRGEQWIRFTLQQPTTISEIVMKMGDFRSKSYPIEVIADSVVCFKGETYRTMSYVHIPVGNIRAKQFTIRLAGETLNGDAFANVKELDSKNNDRSTKGTKQLRIIEAQFIHKL
ncbi:MAG: discoidin domain-containing protein, partial [Prevotellaceae bacterium]|nr:discoidin domain-containing protein [Prevotellaceae bacterium]